MTDEAKSPEATENPTPAEASTAPAEQTAPAAPVADASAADAADAAPTAPAEAPAAEAPAAPADAPAAPAGRQSAPLPQGPIAASQAETIAARISAPARPTPQPAAPGGGGGGGGFGGGGGGFGGGGFGGGRGGGFGGGRGRGPAPWQQGGGDEVKPEFTEKVVHLNRVAKVVKGGRRFSFSALVVVGDQKGRVGAGLGKAGEVPDAIRKGVEDAKKNLITVPMNGTTIPHELRHKLGAAKIMLKPASAGTGVIAGGAMRAVVELAGIKDILGKSLGTNNPINTTRATISALKLLRTAEQVASARGVALSKLGQRPTRPAAVLTETGATPEAAAAAAQATAEAPATAATASTEATATTASPETTAPTATSAAPESTTATATEATATATEPTATPAPSAEPTGTENG